MSQNSNQINLNSEQSQLLIELVERIVKQKMENIKEEKRAELIKESLSLMNDYIENYIKIKYPKTNLVNIIESIFSGEFSNQKDKEIFFEAYESFLEELEK